MEFYKKVGNLKIYTKYYDTDKSIEVRVYNGSDLKTSETYFNATKKSAVNDILQKRFDIFTLEWLTLNFFTELIKISDNTYRIDEKDYFCRIDDTEYFKHFHKSPEEFVVDKYGKRIIDR